MKRRFVIGLTGGIASGKSTVLRYFAQSGVPVVSSDELAHRCLLPDHPAYRLIVRHFGKTILRSGRHIDRKRLGRIVFADRRERQWLERQIHPCVIRDLKAFIRKHQGLIAADIPLLYEAKLERLVDAVVVVWSPRTAQLIRLKKRSGLALPESRQRIAAQWSLDKKRRRADYVLLNQGNLMHLKRQTAALIRLLKKPLTAR